MKTASPVPGEPPFPGNHVVDPATSPRSRSIGSSVGSPVGVVVICALLTVLAIVAAGLTNQAAADSSGARLAWTVNLTVVVLLSTSSWGDVLRGITLNEPPRRAGSAILAPVAMFTVTLPSASLVWNSRIAKVEQLTGLQMATPQALLIALNIFTLCLIAFWAGEGVLKPISKLRVLPELLGNSRTKWQAPQGILMAVGMTVALVALGGDKASELSERGTQTGQGLLVLAWWCLPLGIAIGVLHRHWGSRWRIGLSCTGLLLLLSSGVRSPLILVALAFVPDLARRLAHSRRPGIIALGGAAAGYLLISVAAALSLWRGLIRNGTPIPFFDALFVYLPDPARALTTSGIDTVDGLLFIQHLPANAVNANLLDLLKVFSTAIPSQFYADKPEFISNMLSREYLGFGAAGMFLSGPGYLMLIGGGVAAAAALFAFGGLVFRHLASTRFGGVTWLIAAYTLVRFFMGGDAFDFYQGLTLVAISIASIVAARSLAVFTGRRQRNTKGASPQVLELAIAGKKRSSK